MAFFCLMAGLTLLLSIQRVAKKRLSSRAADEATFAFCTSPRSPIAAPFLVLSLEKSEWGMG